MHKLIYADRETFTRHTLIRAAVRTLGDRRDDIERLAAQCDGGELKDGLRDLADSITGTITDACLETLMRREVEATDSDRQDREDAGIEARTWRNAAAE